jgi:hypothetical protein
MKCPSIAAFSENKKLLYKNFLFYILLPKKKKKKKKKKKTNQKKTVRVCGILKKLIAV